MCSFINPHTMWNDQITYSFLAIIALSLNSFIHQFHKWKTSGLTWLLRFWVWLKDFIFVIYWCFWLWEKHTIIKVFIKWTFWVVFQHPFEIEIVFCELKIWHWVLSKLFNSSISHLEEKDEDLWCSVVDRYLFYSKLWCNLACCHHTPQERTTFYNYFIELHIICREVFSDEFTCCFWLLHAVWSKWRIIPILVTFQVLSSKMLTMANDCCKMVRSTISSLWLFYVYSLHMRL